MDIKRLQALVVDALEDVKAQEIAVFDTMHLTALFDRLAIASGTSNRQTKALAASVRDKVKSAGGQVVSVEGEDTGEWVLVDLGDMIVHIMQPAIRAYYRLEEIWGDKPVKLAEAKRGLKAKAGAGDAETKPRRGHIKPLDAEGESAKPARARKTASAEAGAAPKRASKSAASKSAASKTAEAIAKAPAKKAASKTAARPAPKSAVKTAAKSAAKPAKAPVGKTVKVSASKSAKPARKTAASR